MHEFYHIVDRDEWQQAQTAGSYRPESVESEGFIHCSYLSQTLLPANLHYRGERNLVLLCIDASKLTSELRYDLVDVTIGGVPSQWVFPHIYGPLNLDAVIGVIDFPPGEDGRFTLPQELVER